MLDTAIDSRAHRVLQTLEGAGFEAWFVGGCVRDAMLGAMPHDVDVACNATWEASAAALRAAGAGVHETGVKHGTITAVVDSLPVEVTTYRIDGPYSDARHPDSVRFVDDVRLDLARRDFTMNAIAYHPERGLCDPFGGSEDISRGIIRAVGDARTRFQEDPLRILRAARFASQLAFEVESSTRARMKSDVGLLDSVARERVGEEFTKLLVGTHAGSAITAFEEIAAHLFYELAFDEAWQARIEHAARTVDEMRAEEPLRWAAFLHEARCAEDAQDCGAAHDESEAAALPRRASQRSAEAAGQAMRRMRRRKRDVARAQAIVRWHHAELAPSDAAVRLFVAALGGDAACARGAFELDLSCARASLDDAHARVEQAQRCISLLDEACACGTPMRVGDLAIGGGALVEAGLCHGAEVGGTLDAMLAFVIEDGVPNEAKALLSSIDAAKREAAQAAQAGLGVFEKRLTKHLTRF